MNYEIYFLCILSLSLYVAICLFLLQFKTIIKARILKKEKRRGILTIVDSKKI